jgi:hypothetical protein
MGPFQAGASPAGMSLEPAVRQRIAQRADARRVERRREP